jgi:hypothetical protein
MLSITTKPEISPPSLSLSFTPMATRATLTHALIQELDSVVRDKHLSSLSLKYMADVWNKHVFDVHTYRTVQLDRLWRSMTLLELVLRVASAVPSFYRAIRGWCQDMLYNLRAHPFQNKTDCMEVKEPIYWTIRHSNSRQNIIYVLQSAFSHAAIDDRVDFALFLADTLEHFVKDDRHRQQLHLGHLLKMATLNTDNTKILHRVWELVHTLGVMYGLTQDDNDKSLLFHLLTYAPDDTLHDWALNLKWVDALLHSDWLQSFHITDWRYMTRKRTTLLSFFKDRWLTHILPAIQTSLCQHVLQDIVCYIVLPFLSPLPGGDEAPVELSKPDGLCYHILFPHTVL